MGKRTGKKRKLDYRPILLVGGVALPIIVVITVLIWPQQNVPLRIVSVGPDSTGAGSGGRVLIAWRTNKPARGSLFYRILGREQFAQVGTAISEEHKAPVVAQPGQTFEFYVVAQAGRERVQSQIQQFKVPAGGSRVKDE